jgi:hypothetical protein
MTAFTEEIQELIHRAVQTKPWVLDKIGDRYSQYLEDSGGAPSEQAIRMFRQAREFTKLTS